MSFTSVDFVLFFVIVLAAYHWAGRARLPGAVQWGWLAVTSLFFYGYEKPQLLLLLGFSILFNALMGWKIAQAVVRQQTVSRGLMATALAVNLGLIIVFKYMGLLGQLLLPEAAPWAVEWKKHLKDIPLPIGISFYTFHAVSFLVDLSRAGTKETNLRPFCQELAGGSFWTGFGKLALYINFFPQLIAGPIMKAREFLPQIGPKTIEEIQWRRAFRYLILGFFLKLVVADNLKEQTNLISTDSIVDMGKIDLLLLLYGYSFQIFSDFAGYSLIALGLAAAFGYRLPINFNFPYLSASITEFWRRWHISLSNWLRDYLYFSLGGNRKGSGRTYLNLFLVMFLGGLWHGAEMRYAWWGAAHGVLLMIERLIGVTVDETSVRQASIKRCLRMLLTFHLVSLLWLLFIMPDMAHVTRYLHSLMTNPISLNPRMTFSICVYALPVVLYQLWGFFRPEWRDRITASSQGSRMETILYGIMLYLIITNPGVAGDFIYFQF